MRSTSPYFKTNISGFGLFDVRVGVSSYTAQSIGVRSKNLSILDSNSSWTESRFLPIDLPNPWTFYRFGNRSTFKKHTERVFINESRDIVVIICCRPKKKKKKKAASGHFILSSAYSTATHKVYVFSLIAIGSSCGKENNWVAPRDFPARFLSAKEILPLFYFPTTHFPAFVGFGAKNSRNFFFAHKFQARSFSLFESYNKILLK